MLEHNMKSSKSCKKLKLLQAYIPKNVQTYINQDIVAAAPLWRLYGIDVGLYVFKSVGSQVARFFAGC